MREKDSQRESNNRYSSDDLKQALEIIRQGGIILYPTDTVWGIGCDATNADAVDRIYRLKQRSDSKSMLVLVDSMARVQSYVEQLPDVAWDLAELSEKPITIIYERAKNLATNLIAEDGSIGIRVSNELFSSNLCKALRRPLVSTSANVSGEPTPRYFGEISKEIRNGVDYIVQYRQDDNTPRQASSIVKLNNNGEVKIIRE